MSAARQASARVLGQTLGCSGRRGLFRAAHGLGTAGRSAAACCSSESSTTGRAASVPGPVGAGRTCGRRTRRILQRYRGSQATRLACPESTESGLRARCCPRGAGLSSKDASPEHRRLAQTLTTFFSFFWGKFFLFSFKLNYAHIIIVFREHVRQR